MSEERRALYEDIGKAIRDAKPGELDHELAMIASYRAGIAAGREMEKKQKPGADSSAPAEEQKAG